MNFAKKQKFTPSPKRQLLLCVRYNAKHPKYKERIIMRLAGLLVKNYKIIGDIL